MEMGNSISKGIREMFLTKMRGCGDGGESVHRAVGLGREPFAPPPPKVAGGKNHKRKSFMMPNSIWRIIIAVLLVAAFAAVCARMISARHETASIFCVQNLIRIQQIKEQWGMEHAQKTNAPVAWSDILPYMAERPRCPAGGRYVVGRLNEAPTCTIGGRDHSLEY
jgi:hypothetical protein